MCKINASEAIRDSIFLKAHKLRQKSSRQPEQCGYKLLQSSLQEGYWELQQRHKAAHWGSFAKLRTVEEIKYQDLFKHFIAAHY